MGGRAIPSPSALYVGLSRKKSDGSQHVDEPSAPSYSRARIGDLAGMFGRPYLAEMRNRHPIPFPSPLSDWGGLKSIFLADGPGRDAKIVASGDLPSQLTPSIGTVLYIAPDELRIDLDPGQVTGPAPSAKAPHSSAELIAETERRLSPPLVLTSNYPYRGVLGF